MWLLMMGRGQNRCGAWSKQPGGRDSGVGAGAVELGHNPTFVHEYVSKVDRR